MAERYPSAGKMAGLEENEDSWEDKNAIHKQLLVILESFSEDQLQRGNSVERAALERIRQLEKYKDVRGVDADTGGDLWHELDRLQVEASA